MDIRLRPLRADEFPEFLAALRTEYLRGLVEEAGVPPKEAEEKAAADHDSLFPEGAAEPQHHISLLENAQGDRVGHVFWSPRRGDRAYVYDLFVEERFRGQGVGKRALELVEADARSEGLRGIDLNVWGGNEAARALYRKAGFSERAVFMSKELA
jgi:ribosomal protein S18 acetylase RimI-like enzyme